MTLKRSLMNGAGALLSPAGKRGRLLILIYHRVLEAPDPARPGEIDRRTFDWQMELMAGSYNVLSLSQACERLKEGELPSRAACITFDDGYADNADVALPILKRYGLPATFFVATGFLDGGRMWNDTIIEAVNAADAGVLDLSPLGLGRWDTKTQQDRQRTAISLIYKLRHLDYDARREAVAGIESVTGRPLPTDLMMTSDQVRELAKAGMEVGAHTVSHPILTQLDNDRAVREIQGSKQALEEVMGHKVTLFAYPNGRYGQDYDDRHTAMVKEAGFSYAVSTNWGVARPKCDLYQLPRFTPWHRTRDKFQLMLLKSYFLKSA